jgi:hypothetical protein
LEVERFTMKKYFKKILLGIGRRMIDWSKPQESCESQSVDYRWMDPQNEQEAVTFLVKRIIATSEKEKSDTVCLVGSDDHFAEEIEKQLPNHFSTEKFSTVQKLKRKITSSDFLGVIGIVEKNSIRIHQIAVELITSEETHNIPFEYSVIPKLENAKIGKMYENSADFISPLHIQKTSCFDLHDMTCEKFEPKTGMRDFMDLVQCINHINSRSLEGDLAEFGSFKGQSGFLTASYLEKIKSDKKLFMFDAFENFPVESIGVDRFWSNTHDVDFEEISQKFINFDNVELVRGDFTKTFSQSNCKKLCLVFADCDSYRGTEFIINEIFDDLLVAGGIMIFEDYGHANLLGNRLAVHKAFDQKANAFCFFSQFSGSFIVCKLS